LLSLEVTWTLPLPILVRAVSLLSTKPGSEPTGISSVVWASLSPFLKVSLKLPVVALTSAVSTSLVPVLTPFCLVATVTATIDQRRGVGGDLAEVPVAERMPRT